MSYPNSSVSNSEHKISSVLSLPRGCLALFLSLPRGRAGHGDGDDVGRRRALALARRLDPAPLPLLLPRARRSSRPRPAPLPLLLFLRARGSAELAPAPCPNGSYGPTICVVSLRNADLPAESPRTQNGYRVSVLRWRSVLVPKNTVHNAFLRLDTPLETVSWRPNWAPAPSLFSVKFYCLVLASLC